MDARVGAHLLRLRCPPRGHPTLNGTKGMTVLPPIFDTIPDLGATKFRAMFLQPFLHLRERFYTLAVVVIFSSFWAGKYTRRAKIGCIVVHRRRRASLHNKTKNNNGRDRNMMNARESVFRAGHETLGGKRN